jgi:hypothetical protein
VIVTKDTVETIVTIVLIQVLHILIVKKDHSAQEYMIQPMLMHSLLEDNMIKMDFLKVLRDIFQKIV